MDTENIPLEMTHQCGFLCHANCRSNSPAHQEQFWGSVSCSRILRHAAQFRPGEPGFEPVTFWSVVHQLYSLSFWEKKQTTTTTTTKHSWINIFLWQIVQLYIVFLSHLQYSIMHRKAQQLGRKHFANIFFWQKMNGNIWFFFCPDTKAVLFVFVFRDYLCHFSVFHWFDFSHSCTPAPVMILSAAL